MNLGVTPPMALSLFLFTFRKGLRLAGVRLSLLIRCHRAIIIICTALGQRPTVVDHNRSDKSPEPVRVPGKGLLYHSPLSSPLLNTDLTQTLLMQTSKLCELCSHRENASSSLDLTTVVILHSFD
ncbi:hypothetical protein F5884DRAFT_1083 [Xylogone sp. PMI_703]|nr:hypothetical protein F5884DRAFT_1083 [Xylogone sp. PMI_703]